MLTNANLNTAEYKPLKDSKRLLRIADVERSTGVSRATIYRLIDRGQFPRQVVITQNCVGWDEDAVQDWVLAKLEASSRNTK